MTSTLAAQQTVSRTAYDCAAVRAAVHALTGCGSFDYLAADMVAGGSGSFRARLAVAIVKMGGSRLALRLGSRVSPGVDVFMFARTAIADALIRRALTEDATTQVVVLGAGLDTSGLRIGAERRNGDQPPGMFFEVDLPATQAEKRRQVTRLLRKRPDLREDHIGYVACGFGERELGTALRQAGFDPSRPAVWVWSGVIHYLTEAAVRSTVAELKALSRSGSWLYFDFVLLEAYQNPGDYGFRDTKARFDSFGEVMSFGFHEGPEHVRAWLAEQGVTLDRLYSHHDMVDVYRTTTGCRPRSAGAPWSNICVARL